MRAIRDSGSTMSGSGGSARCPAACFPGRLAELDCGVLAWTGTACVFQDICEQEKRKMDIDKDRVKGSAEQAKGKVKEWTGKVTGDSKTESEGKADQAKGKVRNTVGGIKDTLRGK
jgi:uncharacterized protein YjbJ (UPF0337 family)